MNAILNKNLFFVKEHIGFLKAANHYDVFDLETKEELLNCREPNLGIFTKIFRFSKYKTMTPFEVVISTKDGAKILTVKRGVTFFRSIVEVLDENDILIGKFKQKFLTLGGKFEVLSPNDESLCMLKGKWTSWEFTFVKDDIEFAKVTKKWAGIGKELFTTADNYVLQINDTVRANDPMRPLIMAAVMCIDMVLKER